MFPCMKESCGTWGSCFTGWLWWCWGGDLDDLDGFCQPWWFCVILKCSALDRLLPWFLDVLMMTVGHLCRILLVREGSTEKINITTRKGFSSLKDTMRTFAENICGEDFVWVCFSGFLGGVVLDFCWVGLELVGWGFLWVWKFCLFVCSVGIFWLFFFVCLFLLVGLGFYVRQIISKFGASCFHIRFQHMNTRVGSLALAEWLFEGLGSAVCHHHHHQNLCLKAKQKNTSSLKNKPM